MSPAFHPAGYRPPYRDAVAHLRRADPVMSKIIDRVGVCRATPVRGASHFHHLTRAIVYQQLSGKAAATIHRRVLELFPRKQAHPDHVHRIPSSALNSVDARALWV